MIAGLCGVAIFAAVPGRRAAQTLTARGVQRRALCGALWLPVAHAAQ